MIIYNREQKLLGVSDEYLHKLGYSSFSQFKNRVDSDFSDLFLNRRGYMSNFQYISWVQYILENGDRAKAIVRGGGDKLFEILFDVKPFHLFESKESGYGIYFKEIVEYKGDATEHRESEIVESSEEEIPRVTIDKVDFDSFEEREFEKIKEKPPSLEVEKETPKENRVESQQRKFDDFEVLSQNEIDSIVYEDSDDIELKERVIDDNKEDESVEIEEEHREYISQNSDSYDIEIMAKEFEVDAPILADFVRDFINQVKNIKSFLYSLVRTGDIDEIKDVIQRIKGSSVNLRIEDTSNLLLKIQSNPYSSIGELKDDIDRLYTMIENLEKLIDIDGEILSEEDIAQIESSRDNLNLKSYKVAEINRTGLPNNMFEDMVSDFIKIFRKSKQEIEDNLNPNGFENVRSILLEIKKMSDSINIDELQAITDEIYENMESPNIEFDRLVISWIELSGYLDELTEDG